MRRRLMCRQPSCSAQRRLPDNLTTPPSYRKTNPADAPVVILALTGDGARLTQMDDIAQNVISPALSTISGVAQALVYGSKTYAVRVEVDPDKLDSRNLSLSGLGETIAAANNQTPVGTLQNRSTAPYSRCANPAHECRGSSGI